MSVSSIHSMSSSSIDVHTFDVSAVSDDVNKKIVPRSSKVGGSSAVCQRVAKRLSALLAVVAAKTPEARAPVEAKFLDTVAKFLTLLRVHLHYHYKLFWLANSQRLVGQAMQTHTRIDEMYAALGEQEAPALADWRAGMAADLQEQGRWFDDELLGLSEAALVNEVANPSKLKEILTTLKAQLELHRVGDKDRVTVDLAPEMASLMRETLDRVNTFTDVHLGDAFEWYVPAEDVKKTGGKDAEPFRGGTFGQLFKATWTDPWTNEERQVAMKQLFGNMDGLDDNARFSRELATWSELKHKNILEMLGANHVARNKFFISERATEGNFINFFLQGDEDNLKCLWYLFAQAATGLQYLHANNVEHGGLKTTNLLVTRVGSGDKEELVAKVSDFGMAVVRTESVSVSFHARSEMVRWKAPERLVQATGAIAFSKSDTYSLGLCVIDAASGETPYGTLDDDSIITSKIKKEPIDRPDGAFTDAEWALVTQMIASDPGDRPSLEEVIKRMGELDAVRQREWPFDEEALSAPEAKAA